MFKRFTIASGVFSALFVGLFLLSYAANPRDHYVSLAKSFHIGIADGCVSLFNDAEDGPYHGSIISFIDASGREAPRLSKTGCDFPGFYYRHFRFLDGARGGPSDTLWTLTLCLLWPAGLTAALPLIALARARRRRRAG